MARVVACRYCPVKWPYFLGLRRVAEWDLYRHMKQHHPEAVVHRDR